MRTSKILEEMKAEVPVRDAAEVAEPDNQATMTRMFGEKYNHVLRNVVKQ